GRRHRSATISCRCPTVWRKRFSWLDYGNARLPKLRPAAKAGHVGDRPAKVKQCFSCGEADMTAVLLEEHSDGVLRLTRNLPEARNAASIELMMPVIEAIGRAADAPKDRVVV